MMNTEVYVDNLAAATTENELRDLFSPHGHVVKVHLPIDHTNGQPRGFGFVTMATPEGARAAIRTLHGKEMGSHALTVSEAWPQEDRPGASPAGRVPGPVPTGPVEPSMEGSS
jgi:cold-inducible RNA-binding protein